MDAIAISTLVISIITCVAVVASLLFNSKIKGHAIYWGISLLGAIIVILINVKSAGEIFGSLIEDSSINPLKILIFFLSMTILSITLDNLNFFEFVAYKCVRFAKNSQFKLFLIFYILVSILTMFTSNDIVILSFVPFICYFCKQSKMNPAPYVFSTFVAANTWSMIFVIGNPTNVYVASYAGIDFISYFLKMALPTLCCGVLSFFILLLLFHKQLKEKIMDIDTKQVEINKPLVIMNAVILGVCIILLAISSYIGLEMWYIGLAFALFELLLNLVISMVKKTDKNYILNSIKRAPWAFVPFLLSMFLMIMCLNVNGITELMASAFNNINPFVSYGLFSFLASNIMNNIPMTALFTSILSNGIVSEYAIYATIIGSNLGAMLTPVGALAGIMFVNILKEKEIDFSIGSFIKYGIIVSLASIFVALGILMLMVK